MLWTLRNALMSLTAFLVTASNLYFHWINDYVACTVAVVLASFVGIVIEKRIIDRAHDALKREYGP